MNDTIKAGLVKLNDSETSEVWMRIGAYESIERSAWVRDCQENKDFFYGNQYTAAEKLAIEARGQYALTINRMRKSINGMVGMVTANQPRMMALPVGGEDLAMSGLATDLCDWVWSNSGGLQTFRVAVKGGIRDNLAWLHVIYDSRDRKVKFLVHAFDEVLADPASRDPMFRDAKAIYLTRWMNVEQVKLLYGIRDNIFTECPVSSVIRQAAGVTTLNPNPIFTSDRQYVKVYEGERKVFIKTPSGDVRQRIVKETLIGYSYLFREMLPEEITDYSFIPVFAEHTDNAFRRGEVHFVKGLQEFINKCYGVTIHNAQSLSNPKIFLRVTDIAGTNIEEYRTNYAQVGSVNFLNGNAEAPIVVQGQPLNSAFFTLYQDAKGELEKQTIPLEVLGYGDSKRNYQPSQLLDVREMVMDSMKECIGNIESGVEQLGRVSIEYCKAYLAREQVLRIVSSSGSVKTIVVNQKSAVDSSNPASVEEYARGQIRAGMSQESIQRGIQEAQDDPEKLAALSYLMNDTQALDVDLRLVPGSFAPNFAMAQMRLAMELLQAGVVDNESVLEKVPLEDREAVAERVSTIRVQARQLEDAQTQIEQLGTRIEQLTKQLVDAGIAQRVAEGEYQVKKIVTDERAKSYVNKHVERTGVQRVIQEARLAVKEAQHQTPPASPEHVETPEDAMVRQILSAIGANT